MSELSPASLHLLLHVIAIQESSLNGCIMIFSGMRESSDPEAAAVAEQAFEALQNTRDILDAMDDGLNATHH